MSRERRTQMQEDANLLDLAIFRCAGTAERIGLFEVAMRLRQIRIIVRGYMHPDDREITE